MVKICNIIFSYPEENQKPFLAQWYLYKKKKKYFSITYLATCIFGHQSSHK